MLAAPVKGVAPVNCTFGASVEVLVPVAPTADRVDISEARGRTTLDVWETSTFVEVMSVVVSTPADALLGGRAVLMLETGRAALVLTMGRAELTLVTGRAALLLDATGIGSIKIVDTALAVTVVGAFVSPTIIIDAEDVETGIGEMVMKIVVVDVEERTVVASASSLALGGAPTEAPAELTRIAVMVF